MVGLRCSVQCDIPLQGLCLTGANRLVFVGLKEMIIAEHGSVPRLKGMNGFSR
jgi:hypothetical protein